MVEYLNAFLCEGLGGFKSVVESDSRSENSSGFTLSDKVSFPSCEFSIISVDLNYNL